MKLQTYFDEIPGLKALYEFKCGLIKLVLKKQQTKREVKDLIPQLLWDIEECRKTPLPRFQGLARALKRWRDRIAKMGRFTKNNRITERTPDIELSAGYPVRVKWWRR